MEQARKQGFKSISVDLIYGLPFQSVASFARTLDKVVATDPDRLSVFNYAHLPELFMPQQRIKAEDLPSPPEKLEILKMTIERLAAAGYVYIGMDHFAKPGDELAVAQRQGTLYRNFQGYSTHADCDLIAFGITAIGMVGNTYSQNVKTLEEYYAALDAGILPVFRGIKLTADDLLRRELITQLICHFELDLKSVERRFGIDFPAYFETELRELRDMAADGLITLDKDAVRVLPPGRLLIRNVCMVFDRYLRESRSQRFSKVI
jgi:oxygen-independent coproporphyrinogen-3 oxidase